jgi:hypothetical protein
MKKELLCAISTMALSMLTGCVAMPIEESDAETATADTEAVGEVAQAIDDDPGGGTIKKTVTLSCSINWTEMFKPKAAIKNTSAFVVPDDAIISYTVVHAFGSPASFTGSTTGPLAKGATEFVYLTHSGSLSADHCTAKATWEL